MHRTADGFYTENNTEFMGKVAERLNEKDPDLEACVQHTGGGIFCIEVQLNGGHQYMNWGTADVTWGADINQADGELIDDYASTTVSCESTNADEVADAIYAVAKEHEQKLAG